MNMSTKNISTRFNRFTEYLEYPHSFTVPDDWELTLTPEELRTYSLDKRESTQSTQLQDSPNKSNISTISGRRESITLYDSILEQIQTSQEKDMPILSPVKIDQSFLDDYFD